MSLYWFIKQIKNVLVIIPHAGLSRPREISVEWLSEYNEQLIYSEDCETDRETDKLYDLRDILGNKQLIFPISQVYINVSRQPEKLDESVPLFIREIPVYQRGKEPSIELRNKILKKYYYPFYEKIKKTKKTLILNGHSMIAGHASLGEEKIEEDIVLSDWCNLNGRRIQFAPKKLVDFYADQLRKRLPNLKIGRNSVYVSSYDYICAIFGTGNEKGNHDRVPVIHQETNENLYLRNNKIDYKKLNFLRKVFAEAISSTIDRFSNN